MDEPYSTLEEYAELLRIACEKPRRIEAHTCKYCDQVLIEFPEDMNSTMGDGPNEICLKMSFPKSILKEGWGKGCRLSEHLTPLYYGKNHDGDSLSVIVILERVQNKSPTGFLTKSAYHRTGNSLERTVMNYVFCYEESTILPWRIPSFEWKTSFGTQQQFEHVRAMLQECNNLHENCVQRSHRFKPRRLIEIPTDKKSSTVRVVETAELETAQWCALSYCWGGPQRERAVQGDFDNVKKEKIVAVASLPKTILDAIIVAFELNIPYLWVDALCILQDSPGDLSRELGTMSLVYNHATLVITASKAFSSSEGFLAPRPEPIKHNEYVVRVRYRTREGTSGTLLLEFAHKSYTEPIDRRAWTLQESILARRQVRFENSGICWICPSMICTGISQNDSTFMAESVLYLKMGELKWDHLVQDYSKRKLSYSHDRLLAISAVAASFQEQEPNNRYLAGMWKDRLPWSLFWYFYGDGISRRPKDYRAPSWSWASVDTDKTCFTVSKPGHKKIFPVRSTLFSHEELEIIEAFTDPAIPHLPFGNARGGHLVFNAPSLRLVLRSEHNSGDHDNEKRNYLTKTTGERSLRYFHNYFTGILIYLDTPDDDFEAWGGDGEWEVFMPQAFFYDGLWASYLLLRLLPSEEGRYRRVGIVRVDTYKDDKEPGPDHFLFLEPDIPNQRFVVV